MENSSTPDSVPPSIVLAEKDIARFWSWVNKTGNCWEWSGSGGRYGRIKINREKISTHRLSYLLHFGPIPEGLFVCHKCDNGKCVRPDHLFLGTAQDNTDDMVRKGRYVANPGERHYTYRKPELIRKGEAHPGVTLTNEIVREIRASYIPRKVTLLTLGKKYGVSYSLISQIIRRVIWTHI
jgi:hypothetical protein